MGVPLMNDASSTRGGEGRWRNGEPCGLLEVRYQAMDDVAVEF